MKIEEITDMLRREARGLDDAAGVYTMEGIVMREAAAKLEELQLAKRGTDGIRMQRKGSK